MNVEIKEQMYEGKAKQVFATSDPEIVMVHYKDDATAGDGEKKGTIRDKGIVNNKLSNALMQKLEKEGIPTHYVEELNDRDTLVKKVQIVPLEVIIRNVAAGHFSLPRTPLTWPLPSWLLPMMSLPLSWISSVPTPPPPLPKRTPPSLPKPQLCNFKSRFICCCFIPFYKKDSINQFMKEYKGAHYNER